MSNNYIFLMCSKIYFEVFTTGHANVLKVLYSSSKNPGSTKKASRHIPQNPEKILDAPDIMDDYCKLTLLFKLGNQQKKI